MRNNRGVVGLAIGILVVLSCGCKPTGTSSGSSSGISPGLSSGSSASQGVAVIALTISPDSAVIGKGMTQQLTATATYADGTQTNVTSEVSWSSNSASIATVSDTGLVTGTGLGSTTISTQLSNSSITGSVAITVGHGNLISISAGDPANGGQMPSIVTPGDSYGLVVTGTYEDGTTVDLTATAAWTISVPAAMDITVTSIHDMNAGTTTTTAALVVSQTATEGDVVMLNLSAPEGISGQVSASCEVVVGSSGSLAPASWNLITNKTT